MVGTRRFGLMLRYSGVFTTPKAPPASLRSYSRPISSQHHSTFCTLTEFFLPQTTSILRLPGNESSPARSCETVELKRLNRGVCGERGRCAGEDHGRSESERRKSRH